MFFGGVVPSWVKSPKSGANIISARLVDLDMDTIPEILVATQATGNYKMAYPYNDHSSWLMVMNREMEFVFPPVEFAGYPAALENALYQQGDSSLVVALHEYYGEENLKPGIYLFNSNGKLVTSRQLEIQRRGSYHLVPGSGNQRRELYLINTVENKAFRLNMDPTS